MSPAGPAGPSRAGSSPVPSPPAPTASGAVIAAAAWLLLAASPGVSGAGATPVVPDALAADSLASTGAGRERDRALERWAARASLPELMFLLRQPPAVLGAPEVPIVAAALRRTPGSRAALRRRLLLRLAAAAPRKAERAWRELAPEAAHLPARPRASVFRIAAVLPDTGDYQAVGRALRLGLEAGLAQHDARAAFPVALSIVSSGDDSPDRIAAAFDRAAEGSGAMVGGLTSGATAALATAAQLTGLPFLPPTATDESVGAIGPMVFQVGPSGFQRGRVLAREALARGGRRIGLLVAEPADGGPFARGFAAAAESLGASVVWSASYAPGSPDFRAELRALAAHSVDLLFWDGEARDAETLLRQLAQEKLSVGICGGAELAPERHHPQAVSLLEGALFVSDDWVLSAGSRAVLDSAVRAAGEERANRVHTRGYLAARLIAAAVDGGALCPEELGAALATRVAADRDLKSHGFIDWSPAEATLPVYVVTRGSALAR
jgi:ABC-type branched-subunit amino acid transport system substrate-binding protein